MIRVEVSDGANAIQCKLEDGETVFRRRGPNSEWCYNCQKHISAHFGGVEYRCAARTRCPLCKAEDHYARECENPTFQALRRKFEACQRDLEAARLALAAADREADERRTVTSKDCWLKFAAPEEAGRVSRVDDLIESLTAAENNLTQEGLVAFERDLWRESEVHARVSSGARRLVHALQYATARAERVSTTGRLADRVRASIAILSYISDLESGAAAAPAPPSGENP